MTTKLPRLLKADEISARVQSVTDNGGAIILLYKDARVDMALLDETFGRMNWKREHTAIDGKLFCTISIWDETRGWVSRQDVGVESNMDATKGEASDAFKRAGFNWGIGRELYTAPFIFINLNADELYTDKGRAKVKSSFRLTVKEIGYNDNREINRLILTDRKGVVRYTMGQRPAEPTPAKVTYDCGEVELKKRRERVAELLDEHGKDNADYKYICTTMRSGPEREMTAPEFEEHLKKIKEELAK